MKASVCCTHSVYPEASRCTFFGCRVWVGQTGIFSLWLEARRSQMRWYLSAHSTRGGGGRGKLLRLCCLLTLQRLSRGSRSFWCPSCPESDCRGLDLGERCWSEDDIKTLWDDIRAPAINFKGEWATKDLSSGAVMLPGGKKDCSLIGPKQPT